MDGILEVIFTVFFEIFNERLSVYALWSPHVQPMEKKRKAIKILSDIILITDIAAMLVGIFLLSIGITVVGVSLLAVGLLYIVIMLILTGGRKH